MSRYLNPQTRRAHVLRPDRLRTVERPFGWVPCRLLVDGLFEQLSQPAKCLYLLLSLAADKQGISYYGDPRILRLLGLVADELDKARSELMTWDLLAFDGQSYQLLSFPSRCNPEPGSPSEAIVNAMSKTEHPSHSRTNQPPHLQESNVEKSTPWEPQPIPQDVREALHRLLGCDLSYED